MRKISLAVLASITCVMLSLIAVPHSIIAAVIIGISAFVAAFLAVRESDRYSEKHNDKQADRLDALLTAASQMKESIETQFRVLNQNIEAVGTGMDAVLGNHVDELKASVEALSVKCATEETQKSITASIYSVGTVFETKLSEVQSDIGKHLTQVLTSFENHFGVFNDIYEKMEAFRQMTEGCIKNLTTEQGTVLSNLTDMILNASRELTKINESQSANARRFLSELQSKLTESIITIQDAASDQTADVKKLLGRIKEDMSDTLNDVKDNSVDQTNAVKKQLDGIMEKLTDMFDEILEQMINLSTSPNQEELKIMEELKSLCSK